MNQWIIHGKLLYATSLILVPAATQKKIANNKLSSADTKTKYANNCAKFSCWWFMLELIVDVFVPDSRQLHQPSQKYWTLTIIEK